MTTKLVLYLNLQWKGLAIMLGIINLLLRLKFNSTELFQRTFSLRVRVSHVLFQSLAITFLESRFGSREPRIPDTVRHSHQLIRSSDERQFVQDEHSPTVEYLLG
jgi:hypothetical protein